MNIIKISPCIVLVILFCGIKFSILSNERCQFNHTKWSNFYGSNLKFVATRARNSCVCFVQAYKLKQFLKRRIEYNAKSSAMFNPAIVMLTRSGVNLVNPGPEQLLLAHFNCRSLMAHIDEVRLTFQNINPYLLA